MQAMDSDQVEPKLGAESFCCPYCNTVAHQDWCSLFLKPEKCADVVVLTLEAALLLNSEEGDKNESEQLAERLRDNVVTYEYQKHPRNLRVKLVNVHVSTCYNCKGFALWVRDQLAFPIRAEGVPEDFEEAAAVLNKSPRGATALMRLCIQNTMKLLKEQGSTFDENTSSLVRKGLEVEIQQTMDVLQVLRKNPLQSESGGLEIDEEADTKKVLTSLKEILERRMLKGGDAK
jgi:hypothetical protein